MGQRRSSKQQSNNKSLINYNIFYNALNLYFKHFFKQY